MGEMFDKSDIYFLVSTALALCSLPYGKIVTSIRRMKPKRHKRRGRHRK